MADGDIWGTAGVPPKWLAVQSRLIADAEAGVFCSDERSDLTGRAGAALLRKADLQPAREALEALIAMPDADAIARQTFNDDLDARYGTVDALVAVRALTRARTELVGDRESSVELVFWACLVGSAIEYVEERVKAAAELESAPSALTEEQVAHFARQLIRGVKVTAPRRKVPPKSTEDVIGTVIG